jgi:hypothetical protein
VIYYIRIGYRWCDIAQLNQTKLIEAKWGKDTSKRAKMRLSGMVKDFVSKFLSVFLCLSLGLSLSVSEAWAQGAPASPPPNPVWETIVGPAQWASAPTPDGACRIQHNLYNPGAVYLEPVKIHDGRYACRWLSAQMPGGSGDTVLPAWVNGYCAGPGYLRNGQCFDPRTETPDCSGCGDEGGVPLKPIAPLVGDPINVVSGHQVEVETDYATGDGRLDVTRRYSSNRKHLISEGAFGFGSAWAGLVPGRLYLAGINADSAEYETGNGAAVHIFTASAPADLSSWTFSPSSMTSMRLTMEATPTVNRSDFWAGAAVLNGPA